MLGLIVAVVLIAILIAITLILAIGWQILMAIGGPLVAAVVVIAVIVWMSVAANKRNP